MIKTAKQLKDLIRNLSKKKSANAQKIFDEVQNASNMKRLWKSYQKKFSYAADISWEMVMESAKELYHMSKD